MPESTSRSPERTVKQPSQRRVAGISMRDRLLNAAVESLIEKGIARTTTVEVQSRANTSRGALLHHFASHAELLSATVTELVKRNEHGATLAHHKLANVADPLERAIKTCAAIVKQPSYMAELELWAVARTDEELRSSLLTAERAARADNLRVMSVVFEPLRDKPGYETVLALTLEFARGLALSDVLRASPRHKNKLLLEWVRAARILIDLPAEAKDKD